MKELLLKILPGQVYWARIYKVYKNELIGFAAWF